MGVHFFDREQSMVNQVYDHYEYLRKLTPKRFSDGVPADEALTFAWEKLSDDDWWRMRAYKGKSSFRSYLGGRLEPSAERFYRQKYGKETPSQAKSAYKAGLAEGRRLLKKALN